MGARGSRIYVVDNYDSFVYTIVGYLQRLGCEVEVARNDQVSLDYLDYDGVLVSPGPGNPKEAGASLDVIAGCAQAGRPMLGVCLGHQALAEVFGATVSHAAELMHGKTSQITHQNTSVFAGLPSPLRVTRYHSLTVLPHTLPAELEVTAQTDTGFIMGLAHRELPLHGVQFHPESVLTERGYSMFANWLALTGYDSAIEYAANLSPAAPERV